MEEMVMYSTALLSAVADFLATPPIFYVFGLCCFAFVVKIFRTLTDNF